MCKFLPISFLFSSNKYIQNHKVLNLLTAKLRLKHKQSINKIKIKIKRLQVVNTGLLPKIN